MKKIILATAMITAVVLGTTFHLAKAETPETGSISVNFSQSKEIMPDTVELTIGINSTNKDLKTATNENKINANKVYSQVKKLLATEGEIKTNQYSVRENYTFKDNKKALESYTVSNSIRIKTKKITLIPTVIDLSLKNGATNINNLDFSSSNYDSTCNDMLVELSKKASARANTIASALNSKTSGLKSINASCSQGNNYREFVFAAKGSFDSSGNTATPIEAGKINIYANLDATFFVK